MGQSRRLTGRKICERPVKTGEEIEVVVTNARPRVMRGAESRSGRGSKRAAEELAKREARKLAKKAAEAKRTAEKLLTDYERLAEKYKVTLSPSRLARMNHLRDQGVISTSDLPATLLREFPNELAGRSLSDIRRMTIDDIVKIYK
jgi:hypothetical protein